MEAKDTVMKERELWEGEFIAVFAGNTEIAITPLYLFRLAKEYGLLDYQAEISFKAGIQEVVEWIEENSANFELMNDRCFGIEAWQAKLKEWGYGN